MFPASYLPVAPASQAVVIVRRARFSLHSARAPEPARSATPDGQDSGKTARVFRVEAALAAGEDGTPPSAGPVSAAAPDSDGARPVPIPPGKRIRTDKRPGPLLQVFLAPRRELQAAEDIDGNAMATDDRDAPSLAGALASIEPIFDEIRRAQSFRFVCGSFADDWCRLSQQADAIHRHIAARLDAS